MEIPMYTTENIMNMSSDWIPLFLEKLGLTPGRNERGKIIAELTRRGQIKSSTIAPISPRITSVPIPSPSITSVEPNIAEEFHKVLCQPVVKFLIGSGEHVWKPLRKLAGQGGQSETWQVCLENDDCEYILKYVAFKREDGSVIKVRGTINDDSHEILASESFKREIHIQELCSDNGVCPSIIEAWTCKNGGTFVMEKLDESMAELFDKYTSDNVRYMIIAASLGILNKLHSLGIVHGDAHGGNIMVKSNPMTEKEIYAGFIRRPSKLTETHIYHNQRYKYYLIDMGRSYITDDREDYLEDFFMIGGVLSRSGGSNNIVDMVNSFIESTE